MCRTLFCLVFFVLVLSFTLTSGAWADLVGWWRLDDGSGTTAIDSSDTGNDGILTGDPWWVAGRVGGALEMDGGDYVDVPGVSEINPESITLMTWVNFSTVDPADIERQDYLSRGDDYAFSLHEWNADGLIYAIVTSAGGWTVLPNTTLVEPDTWYHTTLTYDSGTQMLMLYLNGEVEGEMDLPTGLEHRLGGSLTIGTYNGRDLLGKIDDIKIFNEALSQGQIMAEMQGEGFPFAYGPSPADGAYHPDTWANISWQAGDLAVSHDVYIGDNFDVVNEGAEGTFVGNQADTFFVVGFPGFPYPEGLVPGTTFYWRVDEVNDTNPDSPWKGDVWSFTVPPKTAYLPDPADGAFIGPNVELIWMAGFGAKLHTVYFGDNFNEINNATGGLPQGTTTYNPGPLELDKIYYWRVDEFDAVETHKGDVWSFTTVNVRVVDDFEDYNNVNFLETWSDGRDDPSNGSIVGPAIAPFTGQTNIHSGLQSMQFFYNNTSDVLYSETGRIFDDPNDWTEGGFDVLSLYVRGDSQNILGASPIYIRIGNHVLYNHNQYSLNTEEWTELMFPIEEFADIGVNLAQVSEMSIGIGLHPEALIHHVSIGLLQSNPACGYCSVGGVVCIDDITLKKIGEALAELPFYNRCLLTGCVFFGGAPASGATVDCLSTTRATTCPGAGRYLMFPVRPGDHFTVKTAADDPIYDGNLSLQKGLNEKNFP